jgi:hypothetical protein
MRRLIVVALEATCTALDRIGLDRLWGRHWLADWSDALDQRWQTGVWR